MGAGCIPVTPAWGEGVEMVLVANVGYAYQTIDETASLVRRALESEEFRDDPGYIRKQSNVFGSEKFEERIAELVTNRQSSR